MEAWEIHKQLYHDRGNPEDKAGDDLVARRVLRGLGAKNAVRDLWTLERTVFGHCNGEMPLWERTLRLWHTLLSRTPQAEFARSHDFIPVTTRDRKEAVERMIVNYDELGRQPLLLTRYGKTRSSEAFVFWPADALAQLKPSFYVLEADIPVKMRLVIQAIPEFVASLGPYPLEAFE